MAAVLVVAIEELTTAFDDTTTDTAVDVCETVTVDGKMTVKKHTHTPIVALQSHLKNAYVTCVVVHLPRCGVDGRCTVAGTATGDAIAGVGNGLACNNDDTVTIGGLVFGPPVATIDGTLLTSGVDAVSTNVPDVLTVTALDDVDITAPE